MIPGADAPRRLAREWTALLLAPLAWVAALGILFPLTRDACTRNTRTALWTVAVVCLLLAVSSALLAWRSLTPADTPAMGADRARFMLQVALGLSLIFTLVLMMMLPPLLLLGACRT